MAEAIHDALGAVLTRWTMGAAAAPATSLWKDALGDAPEEAELRLLALSGQFLGVAVTIEPPAGLRVLPDVPVLALPTIPAPLRATVRRILLSIKETRQRRDLLRFLDARGWTMHPADWMPAANDDDTPDVYAPWRDWAEESASPAAKDRTSAHALTAESWDDFWPAARQAAFGELRRRDPAAGRALLEIRLAGEGADARLRLLSLLATGLSDGDTALLQTLATSDRAPKVKSLAASLLARLGHGAAAGEDATELAGYFEVRTKGLLRRTRIVAALPLKTPAQHQRRRALFGIVDIAGFASALQITPDELAQMWTWCEDYIADAGIAEMAARSAPDALIAALCARLDDIGTAAMPTLDALLPRLDRAQRLDFARQLLRRRASCQVALNIAGGDCGLDGLIDTPAGAAIVAAAGNNDAMRPAELAGELLAFGLLASRSAAAQAMERLGRAGMLAADPRLDMIRLNAALENNGATR
jgi:hypothetical protein